MYCEWCTFFGSICAVRLVEDDWKEEEGESSSLDAVDLEGFLFTVVDVDSAAFGKSRCFLLPLSSVSNQPASVMTPSVAPFFPSSNDVYDKVNRKELKEEAFCFFIQLCLRTNEESNDLQKQGSFFCIYGGGFLWLFF